MLSADAVTVPGLFRYQDLFHLLPRYFRRHRLLRILLKCIPGGGFQAVRFNGDAVLVADLFESDPANYFLKGSYDPDFFTIARPFLGNGGIYFDVGANYGFNAFGLLGSLPGVPLNCHLFEMHPRPVRCLRESVRLHPGRDVTVNHGAVSDRDGLVKFLPHPQDSTRSRIGEMEGSLEIRSVVLDDYIESHGIERVNFLKMDIEGWEPTALRGCARSLASGKLPVIFFEYSPVTLADQGFTSSDLLQPLLDAGYSIYYVRPDDVVRHGAVEVSFEGKTLRLAPVQGTPEATGTDLLAIRRDQQT